MNIVNSIIPEAAGEAAVPNSVPPTPRPPAVSCHRSNGKVARLPLEIRNLVNKALRDGCRYADIISLLTAQGFPGFTPNNLARWSKGAYRLWLQAQERFEHGLHLSEISAALLGQLAPDGQCQLADLNESLLALHFNQLLEKFNLDPSSNAGDYLSLAKALTGYMAARAQRQRAELERLKYQLEIRKIEREETRKNGKRGLSPETIRQIEEAAKML